jgi:flagellar basal-body rod modification protein FlgD
MMIVSDLNTTPSSSLQITRSTTLGRDDFLQLLITQMQYQDPLNPVENTEFTAQLAQFSSLDELYNINENLKNIELYQASLNNSQAVSFIGKEIEARGDKIQISNGSPDDIQYDLMQHCNEVHIRIYDSNGYLVRNIDKGAETAGSHVEKWDGKDNQGNDLLDGTYTYAVSAVGLDGSRVNVSTYITGKVTDVTFDNGLVYLMVGDKKVTPSHVVRIKEASV